MRRTMKQRRWKTELQTLMGSGTMPGLKHIDANGSALEKLSWLVILGISLTLLAFVFKSSIEDWYENPTEAILETFDYPVTNVQFPTVTICPQVRAPNRWGFIRGLFNAVKFQCQSDEDCEETKKLREDYKTFLSLFSNFVWNTVYWNVDLIRIEYEYLKKIQVKVLVCLASAQNDTRLQHECFQKVENLSRAIFLAEITLDEVERVLETDLAANDQPTLSIDSFGDLENKIMTCSKILSFAMLAGNPGKFGTILSNFAPIVIGGTFDEVNFPENSLNYEMHSVEIELHDKFAEILNKMVGVQVNISLYDLPAIYFPRSSYNVNQNWNTWYTYSMMRHPEFLKRDELDDPYFQVVLSKAPKKVIMKILKETVLQNIRDEHDLKMQFIDESPLRDMYKVKPFKEPRLNSFFSYSALSDTFPSFTPIFTEQGPCIGFNPAHRDHVFKPSPYFEAFFKLYPVPGESADIQRNLGNGRSFALNIVVDARQSNRDGKYGANFRINLNQMFDFFDMTNGGYDIHIGYKTNILVTAVEHVSTEDFKKLPLETRMCRYLDENPFEESMFQFYTEKSCLFECSFNIARQKSRGCVPWYFPPNSTEQICDGRQTFWFEFHRKLPMTLSQCSSLCLPNCEEVTFEHGINSQVKIDPEAECKMMDLSDMMSVRTQAFLRTNPDDDGIDGEEFLWNIQQLRSGQTIFLGGISGFQELRFDKICMESVARDFAIVQIELKSSRIQKIQRKIRVTFTDKIGILGGTFGLFTGMSVISLIELSYHVARIAISLIGCCLRKPQRRKTSSKRLIR